MLGEVAHPLEVAGDAGRDDDRAQIGSDRLLAREQGEAALVDALAGGVDLLVPGDDQVGEGDVIVAERTSLPVPVAATAWESRLLCQQVEPAVLDRFVEARVGDGPEDVPRG